MSKYANRILVVDDDQELCALLRDYLQREGYEVVTAGDGAAMRVWLETRVIHLIILDLMLPGEDGLTLTRYLRAHNETPIIMLSARGDDIDRIVGLEVGADDYLSKPFNPRELLARIRAVMRRHENAGHHAQPLRFGPYRFDPQRRELQCADHVVALTSGDAELLRVLIEYPDQVLERDHLLDLLKGYERAPFDRSIDVQIARLRAKIEPDTRHPRYIRTVWGKGYMFTPAGAASIESARA